MLNEDPIRVLVVDDTVTYRKIVRSVLDEMPDIEVVGTAANGKIALDKIEQLHPDLITLDLEMPVMDGLEVLFNLASSDLEVGVILISSFSDHNASITMRALNLGAFDFVLKPSGDDPAANIDEVRRKLRSKIDAYARVKLKGRSEAKPSSPLTTPIAKPAVAESAVSACDHVATTLGKKPAVVALGISTGGPAALTEMLPTLPADLAAPVLIVQHMPPVFTKSLARDLDGRCALAVCEAYDDQLIEPGQVLIAPGGMQMKVVNTDTGHRIRITEDPPENSCRPSVDYLFRSVAHAFGPAALGVIMTGMGYDGVLGSRLMKRRGATIIAQNEESCVVFGMPRALVEEGIADIVSPLSQIGGHIISNVGHGVARCV